MNRRYYFYYYKQVLELLIKKADHSSNMSVSRCKKNNILLKNPTRSIVSLFQTNTASCNHFVNLRAYFASMNSQIELCQVKQDRLGKLPAKRFNVNMQHTRVSMFNILGKYNAL